MIRRAILGQLKTERSYRFWRPGLAMANEASDVAIPGAIGDLRFAGRSAQFIH